MTNIELQIVRRSLFLSVKEAVEHIKTTSDRSLSVRAWQLWEAGERTVPTDVHCEMVILAGILEQMKQGLEGKEYKYYLSFPEYCEHTDNPNVVTWRMEQAAAAELMIIDIVDNG